MPWLGTFHSIGTKILRRHAELVGLKSDFTILDTDDQIRLMKQVIQAEDIDEKRWPARALAACIDGWKNRGLTPDKVPAGRGRCLRQRHAARKLYAAYQERLKTLNAADFGDLLLESLRLFREHPDVLRGIPGALPLHPGRRVPGHQRRAVSVAAPARPGPPATSAASATTTSRSMAGAAPRSTTSCASSRIFPAPTSSGSSAITARPGTSSPPPRISSPTTRAGSARRCSPRTSHGEKVTVTGAWDSEEEARLDRRGDRGAAARRAIRSTRWRSSCAPPSRCANSRSASSRSACPTA